MSVRTTAKMDLKIAMRSMSPWAAAGTLVILSGIVTLATRPDPTTPASTFESAITNTTVLLGFVLPLATVLVCYSAIAGERSDDGIQVLLSLPNTRLDVFLGKLISRMLIVSGVVVVTVGTIVGISLLRFDDVALQLALGTLGLTVLYGLVFTAITIAVSAASASPERAVSSLVAVYFVTVFLKVLPFGRVADVVEYVHADVLGFAENPDLYNVVAYLSPFTAYLKSLNLVLSGAAKTYVFADSARNVEAGSREAIREIRRDPALELDLPVYLDDEVSIGIALAWILVALGLGFWKFDGATLG